MATMYCLRQIVDACCGLDFTIAVSSEGKLYSFGKGKSGALGLATKSNVHSPTLMEALADKRVVSLNVGGNHAACLVNDA
jgi:alpha-tubulin suppressor-like RCC1 family protein